VVSIIFGVSFVHNTWFSWGQERIVGWDVLFNVDFINEVWMVALVCFVAICLAFFRLYTKISRRPNPVSGQYEYYDPKIYRAARRFLT
jgi:hypothetical protein